MRFLVLRPDSRATPTDFGQLSYLITPQPPPLYYLLRESDGCAERVAAFEDVNLAKRVADLLNRHGMVDAPLIELGEDVG